MEYIESRGFEIKLTEKVYRPREDSFMVIDGLLNMDDMGSSPFVEVGSGSGIVSLSIKSSPRITSYAVDVNYEAAKMTYENSRHNREHNTLVVCSDLIKPFRRGGLPRRTVFNPPYLPEDPDVDPHTPEHELQQLVGGQKGDETVNLLIDKLSPDHDVCYVVISSLATNPVEFANNHVDWTCRVIRTEHLGFETIWLIRLGGEV